MEALLSSSQLDSLLHLLASARPFHSLSEAFHSSFDRTQRYRAALATLALLQEAEAPPATHTKHTAPAEEKQQLESNPRIVARQPAGYPASSTTASSSLLSLSAVLRPSQRLAALFVLYDFSRPDVSLPVDGVISVQQAQAMLLANPFLDILLSHIDTLDTLSQPTTATTPPAAAVGSSLPSAASVFMQCERQFTVRLLLHQQLSLLRQRTAKDVLDSYKADRFSSQAAHKPASLAQPPSELATALAPLRAYLSARQPKPPPAAVAEWMVLIRSSGRGGGGSDTVALDAPVTPQSARSSTSSASPASFLDDGRSSPFANSSGSPAGSSPLSFDSVVELLQRAQKSHLSSSDRHALSSTFASSVAVTAHLTQQLVFPPQQLPALVDKNPSVATALLLALLSSLTTPADIASAYLNALLQCELSLHSMEVVSRLSSVQPAVLSSDFLVSYCHRGMEGCRAIIDRYGQSRMVRLLCVFCQSLLRERDGGSGGGLYVLLSEMMGFCVEFSKVKEATQLYRTLKEWEAETG